MGQNMRQYMSQSLPRVSGFDYQPKGTGFDAKCVQSRMLCTHLTPAPPAHLSDFTVKWLWKKKSIC